MGLEIERKFLVRSDSWRSAATGSRHIRQAYLAMTDAANVRVRIVDDRKAVLTIKSAAPGLVRSEFEYAVPLADAEEMMALRAGDCIEKRRYIVPAGIDRDRAANWEVDVFEGCHEGLVLAEIELAEGVEIGVLPDWLGEEVTGDRRYYNAALACAAR